MAQFSKVTFSDLVRKITETEKIKDSIRNFSFFPAVLIYGFEIIFLLKISQIVLGWHF